MDPADLESRVTALERQVRDLTGRVHASEQDAAAARVLAGAADRDVSEFHGELRDFRGDLREFRQATAASFNALREDFVDLREDVTGLREDVTTLREDVTGLQNNYTSLREDVTGLREHVDHGFIEMRGKFDAMSTGQQQIVDLLQVIITGQGDDGRTR
ncbi:hypothetical protein [Mycobacterium malmoense]|uniref:hypothetical protein n=1 Tax=Mycobacterium malmoense TaxID=1780 RepID=UPI0009F90435|nr:hypothetical protein [Mycobacterium malmoense]